MFAALDDWVTGTHVPSQFQFSLKNYGLRYQSFVMILDNLYDQDHEGYINLMSMIFERALSLSPESATILSVSHRPRLQTLRAIGL